MSVDEETRAAAAAVLGESPGFPCSECDFVGSSASSLGQHKRKHQVARAAKPPPRTTPGEAVVAEVIGKTVANLQVLGGYLSMVLPHTGIAIAGVPGEREGDPPIVQSRAAVAGNVLELWAKRDARVLAALGRFNQLFETSAVVELAAGIGAAVAVDLGAVPADLAVEIGPFAGENAIQPVRAVIGDVIDFVGAMRQQAGAARPAQPNGVAPDGAEVIEGGVEDT